MNQAIALLEFRSVAKGIEVSDAMAKAAFIKIRFSQPVCPGKFVVIVTGEVGPVRSALEAGEVVGGTAILDQLLIPNLHEDVFPAMAGITDVQDLDAVGIVETFSVASSIIAADVACKTSDVKLIEVRLAKGLGGKAYIIFTGTIEDCQSAIETSCAEVRKTGMLVEKVLIPKPHKDIFDFIL
ncbi:BMC domain-containing protein [bacterium]|nr:BMC domain-containing protein [bacterium]